MREFYQLRCTLDPKIRGRYEMPHTIEITSKELIAYKRAMAPNIKMYFENKAIFFVNMPDNITGRLIKRKDFVDFMGFMPYIISLVAVVSEKIKIVFEKIGVPDSEYAMKPISIQNALDVFYLLFVPIIRDTEYIYPKCEFVNMFDSKEIRIFQNREEYYAAPDTYRLKKLTLPIKYASYKVLRTQDTFTFFSKEILNEFEKDNVIGYDVITRGEFNYELEFE